MPLDRDALHLSHAVECARDILTFAAEGKEVFLGDKKTRLAILRSFEVLGEAVKRLSPELKAKHPEIAWRRIAGFRDIIHQYDFIDLEEVWGVIADDLPATLRMLEAVEMQR